MAGLDNADAESRCHLSTLLRDAGVGSKWSTRDLAKRCDYQLSYETWRRLIQPVAAGESAHQWSPKVLRIVAETLQTAGASVTEQQLTRAYMADAGYTLGSKSVTHGDSLTEMLERLPELPAEDLAVINEASAAALRAAMNRQRRLSDDREGVDPRSE